MTTFENPTSIEGRVGIAVETTEGTAMTEPTTELFVNAGNAPEIDMVPDNKIKERAYNEPYKRSEILGYYHTEGNLPGLKFSPTNGISEFFEVAFGNDWFSKQVYKIDLETGAGTTFKRGDLIFGKTSLARAEVVRVVTDTLWLIGVQGTFDAAGNEDLLNKPGGTDYGFDTKTTTPAFGSVSGYYCHKMDAVRNTSNKGTVSVHTTATQACLMDEMQDFSEFGVATGKKKVLVTVKDATSGTPIPISGWMGAPIMGVKFDAGTATFTVGKKLSAKTGAGVAAVIGDIIGFRVDTGTWGTSDAAGVVFCAMDATARAILDGDTLTDDNGSPGAATANMTGMPAYLNNAVKIYNSPDASGSAQTWNGDVATFDETDTLTYSALQRTFDQKSLSVFVKDAGDLTKVGFGTKVREISFDITAESFNYNVGLLGRSIKYPTSEPAFSGITNSSPFGASSRTFELDGASTGQAAQVNRARFSATWDFAPGKGVVISENYPTTLQPTNYNVLGTLDLQWKDNSMMKTWWNNPSGSAPATGTRTSKRISFLLDSGDVVATGYNKMLSIEVLGTIDNATLNRDQDGYIQPVTIEGFMHDSTYVWGPARFYLYDGTATH